MKGRPVRGFFAGLFLGIFLDLDLALGGVVKLSSVVLTILPVVLIVVGVALGLWAPVGRWRTATATSSGSSTAPPIFADKPAPSATTDSAPAESAPDPAAPSAAPPPEE